MSTQMIPFPLDEKVRNTQLTTVDSELVTVFAAQFIQALAKTGRSSMVIWEGPPPPMPFRKNGWELKPVMDESTMPLEIQRRINIGRNAGIPIKQVLIAHELPPEKRDDLPLLEDPRRLERLERMHAARNVVPTVAKAVALTICGLMALSGVIIVAPILINALLGLAGSLVTMFFVLGALIAIGGGLDPAVVCILDDGYDSWVLAGFWYE